MQHLEEGTIHAWLDGALPTAEAREVEQHVVGCPTCAAMVAEARGLIAGASRIVSSLDVVRGNVIPKTTAARGGKSVWHSLRLTPTRAALAATLLIAVSSVLTVRHNTPDKLIPPSAAAVAPMSTTNPPPSAPAAEQAKPLSTPPQVHTTTTPDPRSTLAQTKEAALPANEPKREEPKAATADVAERRDVVDAKTRRSLDSTSQALEKARMVAAAPATVPPAAAGASARMRAAPSAVLDAVAVNGSLPACFELMPGPAAPPNTPHRFALQTLPGDTTQHVVRVVTENGQLDSLLTGSNWTRVTPTEITVRFATNQRTLTLPVRDATVGVASAVNERREFAGRALPSVTPIACRQ